MKKVFFAFIVLVCLFAIGLVAFYEMRSTKVVAPEMSYKNATYMIDGEQETLKNGTLVTADPGDAASNTTISYFGNETNADLNNDGMSDMVFILTKSGGGSGTFYYVAGAIKTDSGYKGTNALFLGDRIASQPTTVQDGEVEVNYVDRKDTDPMSAQPSVGVTKHVIYSNGELQFVSHIGEHCGGNISIVSLCTVGSHCAMNIGSSSAAVGDIGGICVTN